MTLLTIGLEDSGILSKSTRLSIISKLSFGRMLELVEVFRQNAATIHGRTTYGVVLDTSSALGLVKTIPIIFAQYMFAPFPWQVGNVMDVYALLESMLRFVLLFFAVLSWRRSSSEVRSYYGFLLIIFLSMELMWALGTINWGTAMRHHVPGYSIIVLLGAPGLILIIRKLNSRIFWHGKVNIFQGRGKFVKPDPKKNEIL